jgi:hypothetical protein
MTDYKIQAAIANAEQALSMLNGEDLPEQDMPTLYMAAVGLRNAIEQLHIIVMQEAAQRTND